MNVDLALLTETKIVNELYTRGAEGYTITATKAKNIHQGGVALVHRSHSDNFAVEGTRAFRPNVIRAILVSGKKAWTVIGAYIPLSEEDGSTLKAIRAARDSASAKRTAGVHDEGLERGFNESKGGNGSGTSTRDSCTRGNLGFG